MCLWKSSRTCLMGKAAAWTHAYSLSIVSVPGTEQGMWGMQQWSPSPFLGVCHGTSQASWHNADRCGGMGEGAAEDAFRLCFRVTWIHLQSHVWPHEIRFLLLGFTPTLRKLLGLFWPMGWPLGGQSLACSLGTCKVLWGQSTVKTWGGQGASSWDPRWACARMVCFTHHPPAHPPDPRVSTPFLGMQLQNCAWVLQLGIWKVCPPLQPGSLAALLHCLHASPAARNAPASWPLPSRPNTGHPLAGALLSSASPCPRFL